MTDIRNEYRRLLGIDVDEDELDSLFTQKDKKQWKNLKKHKSKSKKNKESNLKKKLLRKKKKRSDKEEMDASDDDDDDVQDSDLDIDAEDDEDFFSDDDVGGMDIDGDNEQKEESQTCQLIQTNVDMLSSELAKQFAKYKQDMIENQISPKIFEYLKQITHRNQKIQQILV